MASIHFLDRLGGRMWGSFTAPNSMVVTKEEFDELGMYAPEHRAQALSIIRRKAEFVQLQDEYAAAVAAEIDAKNLAEAAADHVAALAVAYATALATDPNASRDMLAAAETAAAETAEAAGKATEAVEALSPKVDEMEAVLETMPPTNVPA